MLFRMEGNDTGALSAKTTSLCQDNQIEKLIKELVARTYGLSVTKINALPGYDDINYHIQTELHHEIERSNNHSEAVSEAGYCLKIVNLEDTERPEKIVAVNSVIDHVRSRGIPTQINIRTTDGDDYTTASIDIDTRDERLVCLRTFLPGRTLDGVQLTSTSLYQLGAFVATVTQKLQTFNHHFYDTYDFTWSLQNLPRVAEKLRFVSDKNNRVMVEDVVQAFYTTVKPKMPNFQTGLIHGDISDANIIVPDGKLPQIFSLNNTTCNNITNSTLQICGLIDFHDVHYSYVIHELAICAAHILLNSKEEGKDLQLHELDYVGHLLAGYNSVRTLNQEEMDALPYCIAGRLCQYLVYGEYYCHLNPDNRSYLLQNAKRGWSILRLLCKTPSTQLCYRWKEMASFHDYDSGK